MVFDYFGKVEKLKQEVDSVKDRLNQRYLEILGPERYAKLERIAKRVLVPEAYFNTPAEFRMATGEVRDLSVPMHCFASAWEDVSTKRGIKINGKISTSFYLSEEALKNASQYYNGESSSDLYLPAYVHEFDHFVFSALQRPPIVWIRNIITPKKFNHPNDIEELAETLENANMTLNRKVSCMHHAILDYTLKEISELGTRFLDTEVLKPLGIKTKCPWTDKAAPIIARTRISGIDQEFIYQKAGSPFYRVDESKVIPGLIEWQKHLRLPFNDPEINQIMQNLNHINYEYLAFPEFMRRERKHEKRERRLAVRR